ncbi:isoprenylcysteine carboxylmethyltransferase family protein [Salinadaptatus halalkaliphilus]|uniref:Isoprenylcysteine carboxylmethyltransferase family protein n=1 Tax=Salinadaptatus halalkaliphilus TaxID=2419781 RepID=A0A4S3TG32_9EURY|nr:isoprenylcysteine carboxylmethyltransferase family protein [Salinadaptatus halalkaliphilus]THE62806.1 isoprenylcysteine carboxylmethyltransferase family protein [Salinadaptatus halalkaliphilus]
MRIPSVYLKTALFTVVVPGTIAVGIPSLLARWRPHPQLPIRRRTGNIAGGLSLAAGVALYAQTVFQFGKGDGTPSPTDEPDELVTDGSYAHSRNPMYVGVLLIILGQALRHRSVSILWWGLGCWIGFHNRVIRYEEPHLAATYDDAYEQYCEQVPRWLPTSRRS